MLDPQAIRSCYPSLSRSQGRPGTIYFDNPGGTQCPQGVVDAVTHYLIHDNANHGGAFATSLRSDAMLAEAHRAAADLLGASSPDEIVFGANMTTLTLGLSRALGRWLSPGDEVIVTHLDHDANVTPWTLVAADRGATVRWVDIDPSDCTLAIGSLERQLSPRTRLVAVGAASNAVGTVQDVERIVALAHDAGAMVFVDAVAFAPHRAIDVQALGCDFLACSAYKFFGPHVGLLYGRHDLLDRLEAYKVRPAADRPPFKFETGTLNHEGIAGTLAAIEYLAGLSDLAGSTTSGAGRRDRIRAGMAAIQEYETGLSVSLLEGLKRLPNLRVVGVSEVDRIAERVPTFAVVSDRHRPRDLAERLAEADISVWSGHFYALALAERLGLDRAGGMLRIGLAHYNTAEEVDRLLEALASANR